ncbi:MAG: DEAD/DEAH box helicase family protein [Planctomycetaceae bacterium]
MESSNLSRAALVSGVEWNLLGETSGSGDLDCELVAAFDDLWQQATPLSADVVERYAANVAHASGVRSGGPLARLADAEEAASESLSERHAGGVPHGAFTPRPWQQEALASLATIRRDGYSKALVAVATGLGKTWLAAFDVLAVGRELGRPPRVLVIAHRAEILAQAEATLRQEMEAEWGRVNVEWWVGSRASAPVAYASSVRMGPDEPADRIHTPEACATSSQLVIASIQKLSRPDGLAALAAAAPFDYCVIDEVHHAEAPSYRRVLARLSELSRAAPSFTLGLTATPERSDGVDAATLFDDILAAQATIGDGIAEGSLVPFRYRGQTDSELAMGAVLTWLDSGQAAGGLAGYPAIKEFLQDLNALGDLNLLYSDGRRLYCYHDSGGNKAGIRGGMLATKCTDVYASEG